MYNGVHPKDEAYMPSWNNFNSMCVRDDLPVHFSMEKDPFLQCEFFLTNRGLRGRQIPSAQYGVGVMLQYYPCIATP